MDVQNEWQEEKYRAFSNKVVIRLRFSNIYYIHKNYGEANTDIAINR